MSDIITSMKALDLNKIEMLGFLLVIALLYAVYYLWRDKQASVAAELSYLRAMVNEHIAKEDPEPSTAMLAIEAIKRIEGRLERMELNGRRGRQ